MRIRELLEGTVMDVVPAVITNQHVFGTAPGDKQWKLLVGKRGQMHFMVLDEPTEVIPLNLDPNVDHFDTGFYDTRDHKYLTREESKKVHGAGESQGLMAVQKGIGPGVDISPEEYLAKLNDPAYWDYQSGPRHQNDGS